MNEKYNSSRKLTVQPKGTA
ncbi:hypothetical protein RO1_16540 [Roseburia intestinalis XB6B4]|uniref:Uncharacterized protein n=1 Tax=Roseburia intestinalis XB6B4 TaxID=718255 RepID=D4KY05_9FIRM|nr:hypothetical protein RO1_16540 [Roseburia intestinalis XB6B4]